MKIERCYALFAFAAVVAMAAFAPTPGRTQGASYDRMAPAEEYLITDRAAEIALARSAAPPSISGHATVMVLGPHGYEVAETGTNGFTCLVERGWDAAFDFNEFWNPKLRGPDCFNPAASRSIVPAYQKRAQLALAGMTKAQMQARIEAGPMQTPEPGAMSYMLSKQQYLTDAGGAWKPHVMFFTPKAQGAGDGAAWGANLDGSPIIYDSSTHVFPEPFTVFMMRAPRWSDGAPA